MKNSPGGTVEETGLPAVVVVVDYVGAICNTSLTATFLRSTFVRILTVGMLYILDCLEYKLTEFFIKEIKVDGLLKCTARLV